MTASFGLRLGGAMKRRDFIKVIAGSAAAWSFPARAQQSGGVITIIVPFSPGTGPDILARVIGAELQTRWGQTVIVDNKPGASGNIGSQFVARAAPDGHTLFMTPDPPFTANINLMKDVPYDPVKSFTPIIEVAVGTLALAVHSSIPVTSAQAFIEYAKARPGQINYGSSGVGTPHHLTMEFFKLTTHVNLKHIPFKDSAGAISNLLGGHISAMFIPTPLALPLPQDKIRLLAVTSTERVPAAPNLPTLVEQGLPGFEAVIRFGILAPVGTPREIVTRYNTVINEILRSPQFEEKIANLGLTTVGGTPEHFGEANAKSLVKWQKVLKEARITAE
jgi:tripartite-type tricarboxylate transporter receptor subunit TctC